MQHIAQKIMQITKERWEAYQAQPSTLGYVGAQGHGNWGDDCIFRAAKQSFNEHKLVRLRRPNVERLTGLLGLGGPQLFRHILLGGGTLVNETTLTLLENCTHYSKLYSLGTGIGSCGFEMPDEINLRDWSRVLRSFDRISVRGPLSARRVEELCGRSCEIVGDLALVHGRAPKPTNKQKFVLNLAFPTTPQYDRWFGRFLQTLTSNVRKLIGAGWEPICLATHAQDVSPFDRWLEENEFTWPILYPQSESQLFQAIQDAQFSLNVRLHGAVLSCCVGVVPILVNYRDKCLDFMQSMELDEFLVSRTKPNSLTSQIDYAISRQCDYREKIGMRTAKYKRAIQVYCEQIIAEGSAQAK